MEKEIIETITGIALRIDTEFNAPNTPISELFKFLTEAKANGATHVQITGSASDYNVEEVSITPVKEELESDELFQKRAAKWYENQKLDKERQELNELAQYEKLKKKFEHGK